MILVQESVYCLGMMGLWARWVYMGFPRCFLPGVCMLTPQRIGGEPIQLATRLDIWQIQTSYNHSC